jgi:Arc/MetJ-type ribon-helix-helix transcriptional regulator
MLKTTVYLPELLDSRLTAEAIATGVSKAELIRQAVVKLLDESERPRADDTLPVFSSGRPMTTEQMDEEIYAQIKERSALR